MTTTSASQYTPAFDPQHQKRHGPAAIEHRTATSGMELLGTYFMTFDEPGHSDPWTVEYDETAFVIEGHARFVVAGPAGDIEVDAAEGELIVLPKGTTVRYGAEPGTRLLLSIAPVNWRDAA